MTGAGSAFAPALQPPRRKPHGNYMRIAIRHQLSVTPPPGTGQAVLHLLLTPSSGPTQTVEHWAIDSDGIDTAGTFTDAYGNAVHLVNQTRPEGDITVTVSGSIITKDTHGVLGRPGGEPVPALYTRITPLTRAPITLYGKFRNSKESRLNVLHALMARVGETLGLPEEATEQPATQMQANGAQSQSQSQSSDQPADEPVLPPASDYAHSFIAGARALDIPARYVTGYLVDAEGTSAFHAWAEAYDDRLGWIGFDACLQLCPTDRHVRLAVGLDALSAQPLRAAPAGEGVRTVHVEVAGASGQ